MSLDEPKDDFDAAFEQFSVPDKPDGSPGDHPASSAAPAAEPPAANGGNNDTGAATGGDTPGQSSGPDTGAVTPPAGEGAVTPPAAEPPAAAPAATPPAGGEPAAAAPAATPPVEVPKSDADAILNKLGELVNAASKPAEPKPAEPAPAVDVYTPEEKQFLEQYDKDWTDVAKGEALRRRGEYKEMLGYVFGQVQQYMAPYLQQIEAIAGRTHLTDIKGAVPDYSDTLRQSVVDWTKSQPAYLQPAFDHVINNGTAEEVKDLISRYRQATGQAAAPGGVSTPPSQEPARTNELSGVAKEAAAALAPVESKRSEVMQPSDPSNYDDAWKQAAKDLG